jgi:hypothetical protein
MIYILVVFVGLIELARIYRRCVAGGGQLFPPGKWSSPEMKKKLREVMKRKRMERGLE